MGRIVSARVSCGGRRRLAKVRLLHRLLPLPAQFQHHVDLPNMRRRHVSGGRGDVFEMLD